MRTRSICPFCGTLKHCVVCNYSRTHYYIQCANRRCGAQGPVRKTAPGAREAWKRC